MQTKERVEDEKLWLVRYMYKNDLTELSESRNVPLGHALLRGCDEVQVSKKLTYWLSAVLHEEASIESVELLPPNALKRLSVQQARKARRASQESVKERTPSLIRRLA